MIERLTVTEESVPLDLLLWRRLRREVPGLVEETLARNPGLAALGPALPLGTVVTVDVPSPAGAQKPVTVVRLWD